MVLQSPENGNGGGAVGGDAAGGPGLVDFGEEGGDLTPACSFAGFAGFADEDDEEIEAMASGTDERVRGGSGELPNAARNCSSRATGSASLCGARLRMMRPARP